MLFKNKKKKERNAKLSKYVGTAGKILIASYIGVTLYTMMFDLGAIQKIKESQYLIQSNWDSGLDTKEDKIAKLKSLGLNKTPTEMEKIRDVCLAEGRKPSRKKNLSTIKTCQNFLPSYYAKSLSASRYDCTNKDIDYSQKTKSSLTRHLKICISIRDYVDEDSKARINEHVAYWHQRM